MVVTLVDRYHRARDRILADPRFQRWASGFPLTKRIARRHTRALFDLCAGFVYSQVLAACIRLQVFDILAEGPIGGEALAARLSLTREATELLMKAAASLGLVERRSADRFGLGILGAALRGNPAIAAMVEHHGLLYADLSDPVALLRDGARGGNRLSRFWPYAGCTRPSDLGADNVAAYSTLMASSQALIAGDLLDAYAFDRHRCLLDIGGGEGAFLLEAARRMQGLRFQLLDLPAVAERARAAIASAGHGDQISITAGDFLEGELPAGADIATLIRILHDLDDAPALALLRAIRSMLGAGGTLIVAEPMSDTTGGERIGDAYFGFYLLAMGSGRPRTTAENIGLLKAAGFARVRPLATRRPLLMRALLAST